MEALRAAVGLAAPRSLRRLLSTTTTAFPAFSPPPSSDSKPDVEPSTNLYISGLNKRTTTTERLREKASEFGDVVHAKVVTDRISGFSRGFGFVEYTSLEDAAKGIEGMHGKYLDGWVIFAEYAKPRTPQVRPSENTSLYGSGSPPYGNSYPPYGRQ